MLSIIISSYQQGFYENLVKNIAETIGEIGYEIIQIKNPKIMGICEAYNHGGAKATSDYLLFIHEDIEFLTPNWGDKLLAHLKNDQTGVIGIAGSTYKSNYPTSWSVVEECRRLNIVQRRRTGQWMAEILNPRDELKSKVACLDGVFLAVPKAVWEKNKFDEKRYQGFHGYDIDFSLSISSQMDAYVVYDILVKHYSAGNQSADWMQNAMIVSNKWKSHLPYSIEKISKQEFNIRIYKSFDWFVNKMKTLGYSRFRVFYISLKYTRRYTDPRIYLSMLKVYLKLFILK